MKANELMIGDLVKSFEPIRIEAVYRHSVSDSSMVKHSELDIEPIPLTIEILEKNNCEEYRGGLFNLQDPSLGLSLESDGFVIGQDYGERGGFEGFIEIKYVHELQHMLRLCGLDHLADNLKV